MGCAGALLSVNFSVGFPTVRCPGDRCRFLDGYPHCPRCHRKMFNPSDISHLADFADLRAEALQAGSRAFITLRPKFPSMQSLMSISGRDRMSRSPLRPLLKRSAKRWSTKANESHVGSLQQSITFEPFTAFNIMSCQLTHPNSNSRARKGDGGKKGICRLAHF